MARAKREDASYKGNVRIDKRFILHQKRCRIIIAKNLDIRIFFTIFKKSSTQKATYRIGEWALPILTGKIIELTTIQMAENHETDIHHHSSTDSVSIELREKCEITTGRVGGDNEQTDSVVWQWHDMDARQRALRQRSQPIHLLLL